MGAPTYEQILQTADKIFDFLGAENNDYSKKFDNYEKAAVKAVLKEWNIHEGGVGRVTSQDVGKVAFWTYLVGKSIIDSPREEDNWADLSYRTFCTNLKEAFDLSGDQVKALSAELLDLVTQDETIDPNNPDNWDKFYYADEVPAVIAKAYEVLKGWGLIDESIHGEYAHVVAGTVFSNTMDKRQAHVANGYTLDDATGMFNRGAPNAEAYGATLAAIIQATGGLKPALDLAQEVEAAEQEIDYAQEQEKPEPPPPEPEEESDRDDPKTAEDCDSYTGAKPDPELLNETVNEFVVLDVGSAHDSVYQLQERTSTLGITDKNGHTLSLDGKYGELTKSAVKKLQAQYGLKQDGIFGPDTLVALELEEAKQRLASFDPEDRCKTVQYGNKKMSYEEYLLWQVDEASNRLQDTKLRTLENTETLKTQIQETIDEINKEFDQLTLDTKASFIGCKENLIRKKRDF